MKAKGHLLRIGYAVLFIAGANITPLMNAAPEIRPTGADQPSALDQRPEFAAGFAHPQKPSRVSCLRSGDLFGGPLRDDGAATIAAFRPKIDNPVGASDDVQIMLDDQHAATGLNQPLKRVEQLCDVVEMQSGGRLVEDEQRALAGCLRQMRRQLYALRLAARST